MENRRFVWGLFKIVVGGFICYINSANIVTISFENMLPLLATISGFGVILSGSATVAKTL